MKIGDKVTHRLTGKTFIVKAFAPTETAPPYKEIDFASLEKKLGEDAKHAQVKCYSIDENGQQVVFTYAYLTLEVVK